MSLRLAPEAYEALKLSVFERDDWRCRYCGWRRVHCHHIVFRSDGGEDISSNLVTLCPTCHNAVHLDILNIWSDRPEVGADGELEFTAAPQWRPR